MSNSVTSIEDILVLQPTMADLVEGARYAAITLPWTFNRMMLNTGSEGQQRRGLNIAKGIVAQEILKRKLAEMGIPAATQRKSHRDDDLFDFRVGSAARAMKLDLKTINYYTDYTPVGRSPLCKTLIIDNASYPGPDWRKFFPMLVPHTQINQSKEAYCFAIASSINLMNDQTAGRSAFSMTAFPSGEIMPFLCSRKLCLAREEDEKGIYISLTWSPGLADGRTIVVQVLGERNGEQVTIPVNVTSGKDAVVGPLSCVSSFQVQKASYDAWASGQLVVRIIANELRAAILNSVRKNINKPLARELILTRDDFCNLILPDDYALYVIGWIPKQEFMDRCRQYTGWVWPLDSVNKYENQAWTQITERDVASITRAGFDDCVGRKPTLLRAGWLKTNGHGGGACCYVYPNIGARGGVKETNLYVLPQDTYTVKTLASKA